MDNQGNVNPVKKENKSSENKKGVLLVIILSVIAIILVANAVKIQIDKRDDDFSAFVSDTTESTEMTLPSVTQTTAPENTTTAASTTENVITQATESTAPAETTDQEILNIITNGINSLKSSDASFVGHKVQTLDMELTECSVPGFSGIVNSIIDMFVETEIYDFDFTNGKGYDPENKKDVTSLEAFPPEGRNFALTVDGIVSATEEVQGDNTVYRVKLKSEKSTKDNPKTLYHENACDTLDLSGFNLPIGEITRADLDYPGAIVGVTVDKNGKVIEYYERLEIIGVGEAAAAGMSGSGKIEGYVDETWTIEWK